MKILVAGATGAIGTQLLPLLAARGHDAWGMTRSASKRPAIAAAGATPVVADALEPDDVARAVAQAQPEVIVHQLTALSGSPDVRHFDRDFAQTNRLRTEATDHLLAAGREAGVWRFVAQSYAGWPFARTGAPVKSEDDPLDPSPAEAMRETLDAIRHLEHAVTSADWTIGIVLRYGGFYGPGTSLGPEGGDVVETIRRRKFPLVGDAGGVWSFVHIADAAQATVAAIEHGTRGVYNIVDDDPAPVAEWLPALAAAWGGAAAAPRAAVARPAACRRNGGGHDDGGARSFEREGKARPRLAAGASELARRLPGGSRMSTPDADGFDELRRVAFSIAYRMLGTVTEAEDVVQEALLRVHRELSAGTRLESPQGYVATVATRLAIDELRSARVRRERYVGDWLPEPLIGDAAGDPAQHAEIADSLSLAFLVLLESLSPEQRAVLLLRDVFGYGYDEIAAIVGKSVDNTRQLATRARRPIEERRPRFEASREQRDELARRFFAAAEEGDLEALEALLAQDVTLQGDGGGKAPALARALHGRRRVIRTLLAWMRVGARMAGQIRRLDVNGQPGALLLDAEGRVLGVMALDIADGQIQAIRSIVNPDKLRGAGPVGDVAAGMRATR